MILCREVPYNTTVDTAIKVTAKGTTYLYFQTELLNNISKGDPYLKMIRTTKMAPLICYFLFLSKYFGIWD